MSVREKTLADVLNDAWRAKIYVAAFAAFGFFAAAAYAVTATPYYKAGMIVSPASPMNGAEISSLLANDDLFALRYLVQRVGVANSSDFLRFESIYDGPSVAALLLDDPQIEAGLRRDPAFDADGKVTREALAEYLSEQVDLEPVGGTSLRRLVYWHPDREFAVYFLQRLHAMSDALIRSTIREDTEGRINHLEEAIATTANPEHRRVLTTLLLEQERLRMLVSIEQPYAAAVVEPAAASTKALWPDATLLISAFTLVGAFVGFVVFNLRQSVRKPAEIRHERRKNWYNANSQNNNERRKYSRAA